MKKIFVALILLVILLVIMTILYKRRQDSFTSEGLDKINSNVFRNQLESEAVIGDTIPKNIKDLSADIRTVPTA